MHDRVTARYDVGDGERVELELWAARAAAGDEVALSRLLERAHELVTAYCRGRLDGGSATESVEDVTQEVCAAVIAALPTYRNDRASFVPFLFRIAAHKVTDAYRHLAAARRHLDLVPEPPETPDEHRGPEEAVLQVELAHELGPLLARLPAHQNRILTLRVIDGMSAPDAAQVLGSTCGAVRVAQHRALTVLRTMMTGGPEPALPVMPARACG